MITFNLFTMLFFGNIFCFTVYMHIYRYISPFLVLKTEMYMLRCNCLMLSPTLYENYIIDGNVVLPVDDHYREIRECTHTYDRYVYILYSDFFQL